MFQTKGLSLQGGFWYTFSILADSISPGTSLYYNFMFFVLVYTHKQLESYHRYKCINQNMSLSRFNNFLLISCSWIVDFESSLFSIIYS